MVQPCVLLVQEALSQQKAEYDARLAQEIALRESEAAAARVAQAKLEQELQEARDAVRQPRTPDTLTVATLGQAGYETPLSLRTLASGMRAQCLEEEVPSLDGRKGPPFDLAAAAS